MNEWGILDYIPQRDVNIENKASKTFFYVFGGISSKLIIDALQSLHIPSGLSVSFSKQILQIDIPFILHISNFFDCINLFIWTLILICKRGRLLRIAKKRKIFQRFRRVSKKEEKKIVPRHKIKSKDKKK